MGYNYRGRRRKIVGSLFLGLLLLAGCAGVRPGPPVASELTGPSWMPQKQRPPAGKAQDLSLEQIRDALGAEDTKFTTLRAKARITVDALEIDGPLSCNGYIRLQRPNKLRIIGTKLLSTVFDMLTDGDTFWLYLPSERTVYTGKCNSMGRLARPGIDILPDDIATLLDYSDTLTPGAILAKDVNGGALPIVETWPGLWLIHLVDLDDKERPTLLANLYVDRVGVNVIRYDIFGAGGNVRVQGLFGDYARFNGFPIPQRIAIYWPGEDATLTFSLSNVVTNKRIEPRVFEFSKPKRAEMVFLDDDM